MKYFWTIIKGSLMGCVAGFSLGIVFAIATAIIRFKITDPLPFLAVHRGFVQMDGPDVIFTMIIMLSILIGTIMGIKKANSNNNG